MKTLDCSLPGFSIHGIFQTRVLEWVAISFSSRKTLMIAETVFPSMSKGTKTTLDDVQGINERMYVKVLWKLQTVLHI